MKRVCSVEGCGREHHANGYCGAHDTRRRIRGRVDAHEPVFVPAVGCGVDGCDRPHYGHGYCRVHARRLKEYGDVRADVPIRVTKLWFGRYNAARGPAFDAIDTDEL